MVTASRCRGRTCAVVELGHGGGVDEVGADLEPGEVGAGESGAPAVEELVQGGVHADPDDQARLSRVGQDQRGVLGGGAGLEAQRTGADALEALGRAPRRAALDEHDDVLGLPEHAASTAVVVGAAGQHDHVRLVPGVLQGVGTGVDADQDRVSARG